MRQSLIASDIKSMMPCLAFVNKSDLPELPWRGGNFYSKFSKFLFIIGESDTEFKKTYNIRLLDKNLPISMNTKLLNRKRNIKQSLKKLSNLWWNLMTQKSPHLPWYKHNMLCNNNKKNPNNKKLMRKKNKREKLFRLMKKLKWN